MISEKWRFIFIHVPKTGGNAVQARLLPFSDDRVTLSPGQDGTERFGVNGPLTPCKHARLQDYTDRLHSSLDGYRVLVTLRPPFERMLSLYFSPHRWQSVTPSWDRTAFLAMARIAPSTASFLTVGNALRLPDLVLRFGHLARDFAAAVATLELPLDPSETPLRATNETAGPTDLIAQLRADDDLRATVEALFPDDIDLLARLARS